MNKTKIEWVRNADGTQGYSWNPIKGLCPVGCWYCYARRIYERFKLDPKPWLDIAELNMTVHGRRTGKRVFVCSTFELFHPIADKWRDMIFDVIQHRPDLTFIVLTKMPERIDRPMPDNVWLGASVTGMEDLDRISYLLEKEAKIKFISFEPLLNFPALPAHGINWVIIGKLTGCGKRHDPPRRWIEFLVDMAHGLNYPVFLKNNLREIWGEPLIQEFPK
jgi:protein gp37